jgi:hypothetical protein
LRLVSGASVIAMFEPAAHLIRASFSGRRTRLTFTANGSGLSLRTIYVSPPRGITFSRSKKNLVSGASVKVDGRQLAAYVSGGRKLRLRLASPASDATVSLRPPAMLLSSALKRRRSATLLFVVKLTLSSGEMVSIPLSFAYHFRS